MSDGGRPSIEGSSEEVCLIMCILEIKLLISWSAASISQLINLFINQFKIQIKCFLYGVASV